MNAAKKKMFISGIALIVALLLVAGSAYAWYSLSTKPEVKDVSFKLSTNRTLLISKDGERYAYTVDLSEGFLNLAELHPVSTADGVYWFIPIYDSDGFPGPVEDFIRAQVGDGYDNVSIINPETGEPYTGQELIDVENNGYFVHTDFYLKTEEKGGVDVRLSIPKVIDEDELEGYYGTYVLPRYQLDMNGEIIPISNNAETAVRIGFLIGEGEDRRFVIYEPNADLRSSANKPTDAEGKYILNYTANEEIYQTETYIPTQPIGMIGEEETAEVYVFTPFTAADPGDNDLYVETKYVETPYEDGGGTVYYEHGFEPYEQGTEGDIPTLYVKIDDAYLETEYVENDEIEYYYYVEDYRLYRGNGYGDDLVLYKKNYIAQTYYIEETNYHYFIKSYEVSSKTEYDEATLLYIKQDPLSEDYTEADGTEPPGTVYYEEKYTPYHGEDGKKPENLFVIGYEEIDITTYDPDGGTAYFTRSTKTFDVRSWGLVTVDPANMIVQKSGAYDLGAVKEMLEGLDEDEKPTYDSTMVDKFGHFIGYYTGVTEIPEETDPQGNLVYYSDTVIVHLEYNEPEKITMFVWIEGQDVDCWNDISSGSFNVNLEFAGTTK